MTIEEAEKKICPFMNANAGKAKSWNEIYKCVPRDCMAWVRTWDNGVPATEDETNSGYCERLRKK